MMMVDGVLCSGQNTYEFCSEGMLLCCIGLWVCPVVVMLIVFHGHATVMTCSAFEMPTLQSRCGGTPACSSSPSSWPDTC